jgi:hypothetical protein
MGGFLAPLAGPIATAGDTPQQVPAFNGISPAKVPQYWQRIRVVIVMKLFGILAMTVLGAPSGGGAERGAKKGRFWVRNAGLPCCVAGQLLLRGHEEVCRWPFGGVHQQE